MLPKAPLRPAARNLIAAVAPNTRTATTSAYSTKSWPSSRLANSSNLQCSLRSNVFTLTFLHRFVSAQSPEYCCNSNRRAEPYLLDSSQYLKDLRQVLNPTHESHCKHMFTGGAVQRGGSLHTASVWIPRLRLTEPLPKFHARKALDTLLDLSREGRVVCRIRLRRDGRHL